MTEGGSDSRMAVSIHILTTAMLQRRISDSARPRIGADYRKPQCQASSVKNGAKLASASRSATVDSTRRMASSVGKRKGSVISHSKSQSGVNLNVVRRTANQTKMSWRIAPFVTEPSSRSKLTIA